MSGGSFNYLFLRDDARSLAENLHFLNEMTEALREGWPECEEAAKLSQELLDRFQSITDFLGSEQGSKLREVWKAVEWKRSGDAGHDRVQEALRALAKTSLR